MNYSDIKFNGTTANAGDLMFVLIKENIEINKKYPGTFSLINGRNTKNVYVPVTCTDTKNICRIENKWLKYLDNNTATVVNL